ncbi:MAG TPA: hypothetical protein DF613_05330 [Lachnospiraceae bacterium]|nr:hypothetical protein [Lachnospiraceae bacterium]
MNLMEAMERRREFRSFADWHKKVGFAGFTGCEFALDLAESGEEERADSSLSCAFLLCLFKNFEAAF